MIFSANTIKDSMRHKKDIFHKQDVIPITNTYFGSNINALRKNNVKLGLSTIENRSNINALYKELSGTMSKFISNIESNNKELSKDVNSFKLSNYEDVQDYHGTIIYDRPFFLYRNITVMKRSEEYSFLIKEIDNFVNNFIKEVEYLSECRNLSDIYDALYKMEEKINSKESFNKLSSFRQGLVKSDRLVPNEDYGDILFKFFRTNPYPYEPGTMISNENIQDAYVYFNSKTKNLELSKHTAKKLVDYCKKANVKFSSYLTKSKIPSKLFDDKQALAKYGVIISGKIMYLNALCSVYTLYEAAKYDAIKECLERDKHILELAKEAKKIKEI